VRRPLVACAVLALLTDAVIAVGAGSWTHAAVSGAATVLGAAGFAVLERRSAAPVLDRALLRGRGVRAGLAAGAAVNFTLSGGLFVLPLLLQQRHLGVASTGLAFLPLTLPFVLNPPVTGRLVARFGARPPILAGLALLTLDGLALAGAVGATTGYAPIAAGLLLTGLGVSFVLPALVAAVLAAAPEGTAGAAGGVLNAARQAGATLGVAAMGGLLGSAGGRTGTGAAYALGLAAAVCLTAEIWFAVAGAGRR
jgi:MFS transporter, DHA2 family, methylenomycin A resistance protein